MITHEEARNKVISNHNKFYTEGTFTYDIQVYITQQEKVSKLLELYQKRFQYFNFDEDSELRAIKELERELNE